jgi:hypothetical protein
MRELKIEISHIANQLDLAQTLNYFSKPIEFVSEGELEQAILFSMILSFFDKSIDLSKILTWSDI